MSMFFDNWMWYGFGMGTVILIAGCRLAVAGVLMGFAQCVYMTIDAVLLVGLNYLINRSRIGNWTTG